MTEPDQPMGERVAALLHAIDKLPTFRGTSFRGYGPSQGPVGRRTTVSGVLVATSRDPRVASENFSTFGLFAVIGNLGRDLSGVSRQPAEQEVLFAPGTMFLPIERLQVGDLEVALVEQIDPDREPYSPPDRPLDEVRESVVAAVEAAQRGRPVTVTSPGKFVGGLT